MNTLDQKHETNFDANIGKVDVKPAKIDKDEREVHPQYATVSVKIPMDTLTQRDAVKALLDVMEKEFVKVKIINPQGRLDSTEE